MKVLGWKAWYTQNRVFRSQETEWEDLPKEGVLVVAVYYEEKHSGGGHFKDIIQGRRRYFKATGSSGAPFFKGTLWNEMKIVRTYGTTQKLIKEGIWDDDETMDRVRMEAVHSEYGE